MNGEMDVDLWRAVVRRGRWGNYEGGKNIGQKGQETNEKVVSGRKSSPPAPMPSVETPWLASGFPRKISSQKETSSSESVATGTQRKCPSELPSRWSLAPRGFVKRYRAWRLTSGSPVLFLSAC